MSPEALKGRNYSYSCDYWSVGKLIYYLFYGEYPFGNNITQPDIVYLIKLLNIKSSKLI